jgi:D-sedoheptulose 7-phosphate isomerase
MGGKPRTLEAATGYLDALGSCFASIRTTGKDGKVIPLDDAIADAAEAVLGLPRLGRKAILIGNGGSASIANHIAVDLWKNGGVRAISFSDSSLLTCVGNDFGYPFVFEKPVSMFADEGDVLIAISSSGRSENILRGVEAARGRGCSVFTMSGFDENNPLRSMGDTNYYVPSDSYGFVEITHLALCHCISDIVTGRNPQNG